MKKISNESIEKSDEPAGKTRGQVLRLLKLHGEQSAPQLADHLSLTPMAVRLQLFDLEAEGIVQARDEARGRGRPTKLWSLTDAASAHFPDAHQSLALSMLSSVSALFGEAGLQKIIADHGAAQIERYSERLKGAKALGERVKRLAQLRDEEGYMASTQREGRDWLLIENHCPICSAARVCQKLCQNELDVFQTVLGDDVSIAREDHIVAGARRCVYRVSKR